jgi:hypothetical protein
MPFLLPLLYQVGLGYTPVQSGLLIMPQAIAAMASRCIMPRILARFGYRGRAGLQHRRARPAHHALRHHRAGTPMWLIVIQAFLRSASSSRSSTRA